MFISLCLLLFLVPVFFAAERCPPIFGEFECPLSTTCRDGVCYGPNPTQPLLTCDSVVCSDETVCVEGKCYPLQGIHCNRHVLVAEGEARSIVSDCGRKGRCINGRCALDRCLGVNCGEGELCREGKCVRMLDQFCLAHSDCGPEMDCKAHKCILRATTNLCSCLPSEICRNGQCFPNPQCATVACPHGSYCLNGQCVNAIGVDCHEDTCQGGTVCINNVCVVDPCRNRCAADHDCRQGECRHLEGLPCHATCPHPYECLDGKCTRNDCLTRVCQLGEACENGQCARVAGRWCTWAARDCGYAFTCVENKCVDLLTPKDPARALAFRRAFNL